MSDEKILPCPWCGRTDGDGLEAGCTPRDARGAYFIECYCGVAGPRCHNREIANQAWNAVASWRRKAEKYQNVLADLSPETECNEAVAAARLRVPPKAEGESALDWILRPGELPPLSKEYAAARSELASLRARCADLEAARDIFLAAVSCEQIQHGRMGPAFDAAMATKHGHPLPGHQWTGSPSSAAYCERCGKDYRDAHGTPCRAALSASAPEGKPKEKNDG